MTLCYCCCCTITYDGKESQSMRLRNFWEGDDARAHASINDSLRSVGPIETLDRCYIEPDSDPPRVALCATCVNEVIEAEEIMRAERNREVANQDDGRPDAMTESKDAQIDESLRGPSC